MGVAARALAFLTRYAVRLGPLLVAGGVSYAAAVLLDRLAALTAAWESGSVSAAEVQTAAQAVLADALAARSEGSITGDEYAAVLEALQAALPPVVQPALGASTWWDQHAGAIVAAVVTALVVGMVTRR